MFTERLYRMKNRTRIMLMIVIFFNEISLLRALIKYSSNLLSFFMIERLVVFVQDNFYRYKYFILYGVIGVVSALLDFIVFNRIVALTSLSYIIANVISVHCGIVCSFTLNRQFNFKVKDQPIKRFVTFYVVGMIGLFLSSVILVQLIEKAGLDTKPAKAIAILITAVFQFALNKTITFKKKEAVL